MVDIETHDIVDLIDSRELEVVTEWLNTFTNIKVVSRDGSLTYKKAIETAHPEAIQVSDRFHLLKNLTAYGKEYLSKYLKQNVKIDILEDTEEASNCIDSNDNNMKLSMEEKASKAIELHNLGSDKTSISKELNINIRTLDKILQMGAEELNSYVKSKLEIKHEEKTKGKQELIDQARSMHNKGYSNRKIAELLNIDRRTVARYLKEDTTAVNRNCGVKGKSILDPFITEVDSICENGATSKEIELAIRSIGYSDSGSTIRNYISSRNKKIFKNKKENKEETKHKLVKRNILMKLLYNPIDKIKALNYDTVNKVYDKYPIVKQVIDIVVDFREILKNKDVKGLDRWIDNASALNISEINSFINGIRRDIDAVKNAIAYYYNNGLAEGSVNKVKLIKRIMYGRNSFDMLRKKVLLLENRS